MKFCLYILALLCCARAAQGQCLQLPCPAVPQEICDSTATDSLLWNNALFFAPAYQSADLPEGLADLCFTATDTCPGANISIQYLLYLDLDGDSIQESVVNSLDLPAAGTVDFGNATGSGMSAVFDSRNVPAGDLYRFAIELSGSDSSRTACVRWNTLDAPGQYLAPQLPYGMHRIKWLVSDGLGNVDSCEYEIPVRDCEAPDIACVNGLNVNLQLTGEVTLWATDFLQAANDNATPENLLELSLSLNSAGAGFPLDSLGNPVYSITFTCADLGQQTVELWVRDLAGNTAFCESVLTLNDPLGVCGGPVFIDVRFCARQWCSGAVLSGVEYYIDWPLSTYFQLDAQGCYAAQLNTTFSNLGCTPVKDDDPLNGVDLLDLILINRHILGLEPLSSPYSMIAADMNNSRSITTFDIVEGRKLLTGVYDSLPNVPAWRFVDTEYFFPNPSNPFQSIFPEIKNLTAANDTIQGEYTFLAIKTGDVNCSAKPNLAPSPASRQPVFLQIPDQLLEAGETVEVPLQLGESGDWFGFQLGLEFDPGLLALEAVIPGNLPGWDAYTAVQPRPGLLNFLWFDQKPQALSAGTPLFSLRLRALKPLRLGEAFRLAAGRLEARAYDAVLQSRSLALEFIPGPATQVRIGAPQPNPTASGARIGLELPEAMPVLVELWDAQGRLVWRRNQDVSAGLQVVEIPAAELPAAGVYFWRVRAGAEMRSGRLVFQP